MLAEMLNVLAINTKTMNFLAKTAPKNNFNKGCSNVQCKQILSEQICGRKANLATRTRTLFEHTGTDWYPQTPATYIGLQK